MASTRAQSEQSQFVGIDSPWGYRIVVLCSILPFLSTGAVIGRLISRRIKAVGYCFDDYLAIIALAFLYGECIIGIISVVVNGLGHEPSQLSATALSNIHKALLAIELTYAFSLGLTKISICCLFLRIFGINTRFRRIIYALITLCVAWIISDILFCFLTCRPISTNWTPDPSRGSCGNVQATFITIAISDVTINIAIMLAPINRLWTLQIPTLNKIGLTALFALGSLDTAIGVVRIAVNTRVDFDADWTVTLAADYFWSILESGLAIVISCAVCFIPLFERVLPNRCVKLLHFGSNGRQTLDSRDTTTRDGGGTSSNFNTKFKAMQSLSEDDFGGYKKSTTAYARSFSRPCTGTKSADRVSVAAPSGFTELNMGIAVRTDVSVLEEARDEDSARGFV